MAKIPLDKYYTSQELADYCLQKTIEVIGKENITELLESSAGNGVFLNSFERLLPDIPYIAYDIEPENNRIGKQDYLTLDLEYKQDRCIIGNPPFGKANSTLKRFYKKSILIADYIVFIVPISQLNNNNELYDFDLIYSEDLGKQMYSDRNLHCALNIYKKPILPNKKPNNKLKDIKFVGWRKANSVKCDFKIICFGNRTGDIIYDDVYANSLGVIINNESMRDKIVNVLSNADWKSKKSNISTPNLLQWEVCKYIKDNIPELE